MTETAAITLQSRDDARVARAQFVHDALKAERWSIRAAALAIGTNHTSLGARLRASTPFLAEDIESIAELLNRDPVDFYAAYLAAGTNNAISGVMPTRKLGITERNLASVTNIRERLRPTRPATRVTNATITPMRKAI